MAIETVSKKCPACGSVTVVKAEHDHIQAWRDGELVQNALPELSASDREVLLSGVCAKCFEDFFAEG